MLEKLVVFCLFLSVFFIAPSFSQCQEIDVNCSPVKQRYYDDRERGWYFKEYCEPPKILKKKERFISKKYSEHNVVLDWDKIQDTAYLDTLDAPTFKKVFEAVKNEVVYHPDSGKMLAYLKLQDYMKNKSLEFAYIWRNVLLDHPELDSTFKNPTSNYGAMAANVIKNDEKRKIMERVREEIGLFFFISGDCPYCHEEAKILRLFVADYSIAVKTISNDYCPSEYLECFVEPGMFNQLNVKVTPTIVAVYRDEYDNPQIQTISTGITTEDDLVNRLVFYYRYFKTGKFLG